MRRRKQNVRCDVIAAQAIAVRIAAARFRKPEWALEWEADALKDSRVSLLESIATAGRDFVNETYKTRLRAIYRIVRDGEYRETVTACVEAAVLITWDLRERGGDHNLICNFQGHNTLAELGEPIVADDEFDLGYLTVRNAYY